MKIIHCTLINAIIILFIGATAPAFSQENTDNNKETNRRSLNAGVGIPSYSQPVQGQIGLGIGAYPEYEGSDHYAATALPLINIRKPGVYFLKGASINTNDGLASAGLTLLHFSYSEESTRRMQLVIGPLIRAYNGRDESDSHVLNGLGDIDRNIGIGGFMEFSAGSWMANITVSPQDAGHDKDGLLATFDIAYSTPVSDGLKISTGLVTSWGDDDYMQGYFGITDTQAARSGLSRFDSKAGFKDVGIQIKASYAVTPRWVLEGQVGYWRLLNDAADSPIIKGEGSADQVRGLVGLSYKF